MSYQEKKSILSIFTGALVLAAYCIYTFGKYHSGAVVSGDLKFWATTMLIFVGISVAVSVVIQILFHIFLSASIAVKEKVRSDQCDDKDIGKKIELEMIEDERDKLIELKSLRIGFVVAGIGFVGGLVALVLNSSAVVMLNILYISFFVGSLFQAAGQLSYYRRGV